MNARDYLKIMQRERLEESQAVMLPLEEAKKIQKQIKSLQVYLDRSIKEGSTILLDYMQKLEADKDFYINYALEIARCERLLGDWRCCNSSAIRCKKQRSRRNIVLPELD